MNEREVARVVRTPHEVGVDSMREADWQREALELLEPGQTQTWGAQHPDATSASSEAIHPVLPSAEEKKWEAEAAELRAENEKRRANGEGKRGLLTVNDAAAYASVSVRELMSAMRRGELKPVKVGLGGAGTGRWRFERRVLDAWMAGRGV